MIDITMMPGSHTYWKMPGDAGVPPVFAFNGSKNVAKADVLFPAPKRISEDGLEAFGYSDHVAFPVAVTPTDGAKPAVLEVDVTYAVCNKICIPAHGTGRLALAPDGSSGDAAAAALVTGAFAEVPKPIPADERADLKIAADAGAAKPTWTLTWTGKQPIEDVFADAPEGFFFATRKRGPASWSLIADQSVGATKPVPVTLTLSRKDGGLLVRESLDLPPPSR